MTSPALIARVAAQIRWPGAVVVERGRGHIKHRHPIQPNRFMLDTQVGGVGWHYGPSNLEVDTAWEPGVAPWAYQMVKAEFNAYLLSRLDAGMVGRYTDPTTGEYVEFDPQNLQWTNDLDQIQSVDIPKSVDAVISDDTARWPNGYGPGRHFSWQAQTARFEKLLTIDTLASLPTANATIRAGGNPSLELQLTFRRSAGVQIWINGALWNEASNNPQPTSGLVEFRQISTGQVLWWFNLPRSWDSAGNQVIGTFWFKKQGPNLNVFHRIPLAWIEDAARVWPIKVDTTIDKQVAANGDDAMESVSSGVVSITPPYNYLEFGYRWETFHIGLRFTAISGLSGVTIDKVNTYLTFRALETDSGAFVGDWYAHDVAAPGSFSGAYDISGRPRTTATCEGDGVDFGNWTSGGDYNFVGDGVNSIGDIIQELANSYDPSAIALLHIYASGTGERETPDYSNSTTLCPKLHIEYTAGGTSGPRGRGFNIPNLMMVSGG